MVNEWTRDDLPSVGDILDAFVHWNADPGPVTGHALDAVVEHLNANGGAPADPADQLMHEVNNPDPEKVALDEARIKANIERNEARRETDRWRRAHEIVEGERDQARDSLRSLRGAHSRLTRDYRHLSDRAEAAESSTAPAVSYDEILNAVHGNETGIYGLGQASAVADAVWSLVSGADPAVLVVRESDVAAVEVERDSHGEWFADGEHVYALGAADSRNLAVGYMQKAIRRLAVARAIEQDAATDPITDAIRDGLNVWGTTDEGVRQIAESVRRAISNDGGENVL